MEKDIGKINKNDTTDIIIRLDDFGGRKGLTIREFVSSDRYTGFTKSGVRILAEDFSKFKEMVNSISEADLRNNENSSELPKKTSTQPKPQKKLTNSEDLPDY